MSLNRPSNDWKALSGRVPLSNQSRIRLPKERDGLPFHMLYPRYRRPLTPYAPTLGLIGNGNIYLFWCYWKPLPFLTRILKFRLLLSIHVQNFIQNMVGKIKVVDNFVMIFLFMKKINLKIMIKFPRLRLHIP